MTNKDFAKQLELRTRQFGIAIIRLSSDLPNSIEGKVIRNQITKSGTSVGANYREANRSRSKRDFKNKIKISESEASETEYWLELIKDLNWVKQVELKAIIKETKELLALFTSISNKL
ncbi:four helix bundle protein [Hyunsoonleella jejuensis]|uniref:Four helix bundle protein n=1 Tax=Hyunsoonleella jejuensis TaxID=419940 RepID=A0A1H9GXU2_9FLAO|nr:four helix bundle protein [Hyunsoonleella jejuensis]SEQ54860.1 four helix bundle protein [Hyunsoonleella jejuensis]